MTTYRQDKDMRRLYNQATARASFIEDFLLLVFALFWVWGQHPIATILTLAVAVGAPIFFYKRRVLLSHLSSTGSSLQESFLLVEYQGQIKRYRGTMLTRMIIGTVLCAFYIYEGMWNGEDAAVFNALFSIIVAGVSYLAFRDVNDSDEFKVPSPNFKKVHSHD